MNPYLTTMCAFLAICAVSMAEAGKYNPVLSIGDAAPVWETLPGTDGSMHSLSDLADRQAIVVVFTCNSCPYSEDYEDRMIEFVRAAISNQTSVALVAINVNTVPEDRFEKMQERATAKKFPFPYLYDESQSIGKAYGAKYTPEFFVLDQQRRVVYMGAMDDNTDADQVQTKYVEQAVQAVLRKHPVEPAETGARGCAIRYSRRRTKTSD